MSKFKQNLANIITCTRIIGTIVMAFLPIFSTSFFIVYAYTGFTDVADGFVARRLGTTSTLGSKLDSISDLLFYTVMMIKILPYLILYLPRAVMMAIYFIFGLRLSIYLYTGITRRKFLSSHSYFNKATGLMLFFVPFLIKRDFFTYYAVTICTIAAISALNEVRLLSKKEL